MRTETDEKGVPPPRVVTEEQAYSAMFFLLKHFPLEHCVGAVLSDLQLLADGSPADPAVSEDWKRAVDYALAGGKADQMELTEGPS
jgi:hypothetical protein